MSWIKPSFFWMMYRSGWASKADLERVLAIDVAREDFDRALAIGCLSSFGNTRSEVCYESWRSQLRDSDVVIQWDPDRSQQLTKLETRAIQIGLRGKTLEAYASSWVQNIEDITQLCLQIRDDVHAGGSSDLAPVEKPYIFPNVVGHENP